MKRIENRSSIGLLLLLAVLLIGGIGTVWSSSLTTRLETPAATDLQLADDERAYYDYVQPRLSRLATDSSTVADMVEARSRDILALSAHGNRITRLADEIVRYGETRGVPARFSDIHASMVEGCNLVTSSIAAAEDAFLSFDFDQIADLVPRFQEGATLLQESVETLSRSVGAPRAA